MVQTITNGSIYNPRDLLAKVTLLGFKASCLGFTFIFFKYMLRHVGRIHLLQQQQEHIGTQRYLIKESQTLIQPIRDRPIT